jgi:hypothetical protein
MSERSSERTGLASAETRHLRPAADLMINSTFRTVQRPDQRKRIVREQIFPRWVEHAHGNGASGFRIFQMRSAEELPGRVVHEFDLAGSAHAITASLMFSRMPNSRSSPISVPFGRHIHD